MVIFKLCWAAYVYHLVKTTHLLHKIPGKAWIRELVCWVNKNLGEK